MKKYALILVSISLLLFFATGAFAQQEAGDKELGLSGSAQFTHSHVTGSMRLEGTFGYYPSQANYVGISFAPSFSFGGGTIGVFSYGGEYRHLFGTKNSKVWPFLGVQGGASTLFAKVLGTSITNTNGTVAPEFGLKFYASRSTAFEVMYQMPIALNGTYSGFGDRSQSFISFGFKHLFGKGKQ